MLNAEKYKDEIAKVGYDFALSDERTIIKCGEDCDKCKFYGDKCKYYDEDRAKPDKIKWLLEEYTEPILNEDEKKILRGVIEAIKPFTDVKPLILRGRRDKTEPYIVLCYGDEDICLPTFKDTMFENLEIDKPYGLEELGLWRTSKSIKMN